MIKSRKNKKKKSFKVGIRIKKTKNQVLYKSQVFIKSGKKIFFCVRCFFFFRFLFPMGRSLFTLLLLLFFDWKKIFFLLPSWVSLVVFLLLYFLFLSSYSSYSTYSSCSLSLSLGPFVRSFFNSQLTGSLLCISSSHCVGFSVGQFLKTTLTALFVFSGRKKTAKKNLLNLYYARFSRCYFFLLYFFVFLYFLILSFFYRVVLYSVLVGVSYLFVFVFFCFPFMHGQNSLFVLRHGSG